MNKSPNEAGADSCSAGASLYNATDWEPHPDLSGLTDLIFNPQLDAGIELSHRIDSLLRDRDRLRSDAARYRWLRGEGQTIAQFWIETARDPVLTLKTLDARIDRQIRLEMGDKP